VVLVAESGVHQRADVRRLADIEVDAMLVGESLVRSANVGHKVRELLIPRLGDPDTLDGAAVGGERSTPPTTRRGAGRVSR
jgi:hypothetical protein